MNSKEYYDELAIEYEESNEFWNNPYDAEVWRLEHDVILPYLYRDKPLLDIGCGFYPHDNFPSDIKIIAGDISLESLRVAKEHTPPSLNVEFVPLDAHKMPFPNGSFHQAIGGGELFNHVDYVSVTNEIYRVLSKDGILLVAFGTKWCFDSLWAILDSFIGNKIGYSITKEQAKNFFSSNKDAEVIWEITPHGKFNVKLLKVNNVRKALVYAGFDIIKIRSTNMLSGLVPLPWQQDNERHIARFIAKFLILLDRFVGKIYPLNLFAGNVFMLCRKK